jgi:hypothetical protein
MVLRVRPAVIVANIGLWGIQWSEEPGGNVDALMSALDWAATPDGGGVKRIIWKTTTAQLANEYGAFDARVLETQHEERVVAAFRSRGWAILDAKGATAPLVPIALSNATERVRVFEDAVHFTRPVYRALNELLVAVICSEGVREE